MRYPELLQVQVSEGTDSQAHCALWVVDYSLGSRKGQQGSEHDMHQTHRIRHIIQGISCEEELHLPHTVEIVHDQVLHCRLGRGRKIGS